MQAFVGFSVPPAPMMGKLELEGDGVLRLEADALVLEGSAWTGRRYEIASYAFWALCIVFVAALAVTGRIELEHPPRWLIAVCLLTGASRWGLRSVGERSRAARQIRLAWSEVHGVAPFGASMHLFTTQGEAIVTGPAVHQLGEAIAARVVRR